MRTSHTVFDRRSPLSGRVRVIEDTAERRLIVAGDTLSVYPLGGKWDRVTREYWWHAIDAAPVPARPSALFVGLGGGTSLHVLRARCRPRSVTVIDHRRRAKTRRGFASAIASIPAADNPADRSSASGSMSAGGNE